VVSFIIISFVLKNRHGEVDFVITLLLTHLFTTFFLR